MIPPIADALRLLHDLAGPDRAVDIAVLKACGARVHQRPGQRPSMRLPGSRFDAGVPNLTRSITAARELITRVLPDFWVTSGLCALSGHASIGPDYNGPAGARLRAEWPEADFHDGIHADLAPGDGPHRECAALLTCLLTALERRPAPALVAARGTEPPRHPGACPAP